LQGDRRLRFAARRTAAAARLGTGYHVGLTFFCLGAFSGSGIFQPGRGTSPPAPSTARQPFERQYRFFDLFPLESELGEHLVYVQSGHPPNGLFLFE
jgi:hypothetical protein